MSRFRLMRHLLATTGGGGGGGTVTYDTTMGVSVDANGFTLLSLRSGANRYYVSNSGNDSNAGTNPAAPLATITAAQAKLTAGNGDQMLLAEGSTFNDVVPQLQTKGGFSATYPTLIASYDPADPTNEAKIGMGHQRGARPVIVPTNALITSSVVSFLAFKGIDINPGNTPDNQVTFNGDATGGPSYVLIENCIFRYTGVGLIDGGDGVATARSQHVIIRNNSFYSRYTHTSAPVGNLYIDGFDHLTYEDNVNYHSGWDPAVSRDTNPDLGGPSVFRHPVYFQANTNHIIVRRNLHMDGSADAGIIRGDNATVTENVNLYCPTGTGLGPGNPVEYNAFPSGCLHDVSYNLSMHGIDMNTGSPRGTGYTLGNMAPGSRVHHNLLLWNAATVGVSDHAFETTGPSAYGYTRTTTTLFDYNVVYHWSSFGAVATESGTTIANTYSNNLWDATTLGTNANSQTATFPNAYTEAQLYAALTATFPSITDYASLVTYVIDHPEAHVQRTLRTTAFAGYGIS